MRGKKSYLARGWRWLAAFLAVLWRRPVAVSWLTDGGSKRRCCDLLPPPCCFDTASSLCFRCSFCQQRSSLSTVASWRCWCCWRLVAVSWLTDGGSKQRQRSYFFQCFPMILPVCFLQVFNSSFLLLCFGLSLSLSLFWFFSFSPFSLFGFFFLRVLSLFFSVFRFSPSFRFLLLPYQCSWVLFIEPRAWLFTVLMGSSRLVGHWARLPRFGSPRFSGRCAAGGRPVCSVGGLQAREGPEKFKQKPLFPSSPLQCSGGRRKRNSVLQNDTVLLFFFFFDKMHETASFWRKRAVSFKCGASTRQFSNQPSIIFCSFQLHPCQN